MAEDVASVEGNYLTGGPETHIPVEQGWDELWPRGEGANANSEIAGSLRNLFLGSSVDRIPRPLGRGTGWVICFGALPA